MLTALLTALTLTAFAANSLLCRIALGGELIDPISFTTIRLLGGAAILALLARVARKPEQVQKQPGSWNSGIALFVYALAFSLAYVYLETGMGALILFGAVQVTMIGWGLVQGERPHLLEWLGLVLASGGLVYLLAPGIDSPPPVGAMLMAVSGIAWGVYSVRGKGSVEPALSTAGNFVRTVPMTLFSSLIALSSAHAHLSGIFLALFSGTVTSGLGYVLWYRALQGLTATRAALVQLLVPILAAFGGIVVLSEVLTWRLTIAAGLVLGGIATAVSVKRER